MRIPRSQSCCTPLPYIYFSASVTGSIALAGRIAAAGFEGATGAGFGLSALTGESDAASSLEPFVAVAGVLGLAGAEFEASSADGVEAGAPDAGVAAVFVAGAFPSAGVVAAELDADEFGAGGLEVAVFGVGEAAFVAGCDPAALAGGFVVLLGEGVGVFAGADAVESSPSVVAAGVGFFVLEFSQLNP